MTFPVGLGVVTHPSQVTGVAQLAAGRDEDTAEVAWADEAGLDGEGEYEDETDKDHTLSEEKTGVALADPVTEPSSGEGENAPDDVDRDGEELSTLGGEAHLGEDLGELEGESGFS
jgi:hypothetical protein